MPETYPKTINKLPVRLENDGANHDVLAWVLAKNKDGSYPGGYVLAHNPHMTDAYVVWNVVTADGGETWHVTGSGDYSRTYGDAALKFMFRLSGRDIATEALTEPEPWPNVNEGMNSIEARRYVGKLPEAALEWIIGNCDDSSAIWDAAIDEREAREAQRAANNGEMNGVTPEF